MAAPKGNQFWMLRSKHGRDKLFATPEALWEAACEYFQWCDENPWTTRKAIQRTMPVRRKKGKRTETVNEQQTQQEVSPTQRPYSLTGLCMCWRFQCKHYSPKARVVRQTGSGSYNTRQTLQRI